MLLGNPGFLLNVKGEDVIKFPKLTYTKEDVQRIYHVFSILMVQEVIQVISFTGEETLLLPSFSFFRENPQLRLN